jgi:hypothetical protein
LTLAAAVLAGGSQRTRAHHAFAAEFDSAQPVKLTGLVTRLQWTNPHSWLYLDVTEADGKVTPWAVEFGAPYALLRRGLRRTDFPIGVSVVVTGFRAKNGKPVANASSVAFPDGRSFYTAAADSPDGARQGGAGAE